MMKIMSVIVGGIAAQPTVYQMDSENMRKSPPLTDDMHL